MNEMEDAAFRYSALKKRLGLVKHHKEEVIRWDNGVKEEIQQYRKDLDVKRRIDVSKENENLRKQDEIGEQFIVLERGRDKKREASQ